MIPKEIRARLKQLRPSHEQGWWWDDDQWLLLLCDPNEDTVDEEGYVAILPGKDGRFAIVLLVMCETSGHVEFDELVVVTVSKIVLAYLRHSLTNYDTLRDSETRDTLREEIRVAARKAYPWLRPEVDPRQAEPAVAPQDERVMNMMSRTLADLYSWKAQLESALRDLKRQRPPEGKVKVAALQAELAQLDARIAQEHECCQIIQDQANLPKGEFWDRGPKALVMFRQRDPEYLFGGKSLPASYTQLLGYSCCHCGQLVRRSKAPVDAGNGIKKLYAISCHCFSILMPRDYSYPSAKVWDELYETKQPEGYLSFLTT